MDELVCRRGFSRPLGDAVDGGMTAGTDDFRGVVLTSILLADGMVAAERPAEAPFAAADGNMDEWDRTCPVGFTLFVAGTGRPEPLATGVFLLAVITGRLVVLMTTHLSPRS